MSSLVDLISKVTAPLRNRVANMVARAVISAVDDAKKVQLVQLGLLTDETRDDIERFQEYGFTSNPPTGSEAVVVFVGGSRDHGLAIGVEDRRYRIRNLTSGEVAVYDQTGSKIVLKANGDIELTPSANTVINGTLIRVGGSVEPVIKGTSYLSAESTFVTAVTTFATAVGVATPAVVGAAATLLAAGTAFTVAGTAAKSTKVTVG